MVIIYFLTPKSVIKVTTKAAEFVPILGPGVEYIKKAQKLTDISDPVTASSRGVGMIFKSCFGKTAVVSAECVLWLGLSVAGAVIAASVANPNPVTIGSAIHLVSEIYENNKF